MIRAEQLRVAAAVNDQAILDNCLGRSPDIRDGRLPLSILSDRLSATSAYNEALDAAPPDGILILAHQDVYLPAGWAERVTARLQELTERDPDWAVAGLFGKSREGGTVGQVWSTGLDQLIRGNQPAPGEVAALDELLLIVRPTDSLRFDSQLPGFHLYGVDIILQAARLGRRAYAIDAPVIHHDRVIPRLDPGYKKAWRYMRNRWRSQLPIPTLIAPLDTKPWTLLETDLRILWLQRGWKERVTPISNPGEIARRLGLE